MIVDSKEVIHNSTMLALHDAHSKVEVFIKDLKDDLETLKEECFQRHVPAFYEEVCYYNWFHKDIPQSLLLSDCYKAFTEIYLKEGRSLFEAISAFLEEYEKEN